MTAEREAPGSGVRLAGMNAPSETATEPATDTGVEEPPPTAPDPDRVDSSQEEEVGTINLARICWLITVGACLVGVLILALKREWGYAGVTFAVAISAAINLL